MKHYSRKKKGRSWSFYGWGTSSTPLTIAAHRDLIQEREFDSTVPSWQIVLPSAPYYIDIRDLSLLKLLDFCTHLHETR